MRTRKEESIVNFNNFLEKLILEAKSQYATDIHFLVNASCCLIKIRVNEKLIALTEVDSVYYQKLSMYIKFISHMNLNISKSPQSSAFNININKIKTRIRVSTLPSFENESIVLRINNTNLNEEIKKLLLFEEQEKVFTNILNQSTGLILITGPTCSGKTTLTYSLLNYLKDKSLAIVTIEDPVEQFEQGFVQLQINENAGVNYESGVKEILRHDPDVILIGEIRDAKTAKAAIRASLTGHLVISTMHATDALKALYRLLEFGMSIQDLEQTLILVTNQRLTINEETKKIILEYLNQIKILEALTYMKYGGKFDYKKINDYLVSNKDFLVVKK